MMTFNQMALHTQPGCLAANGTNETGQSGGGDCSVPAGCTVVCLAIGLMWLILTHTPHTD